jgi:Vesicle coat protein involved in Golgi to plasma membrane transport
VSQSTPSDSEVFALVRKACLRTLHCEVFEDPIYFDDDKNGSVIGYEFRVKDSEGRGHQRQYSLLIIMKDRIHLQQLWSFLQHHIHVIASNIKNLAQQVFDADLKENPLLQHSISASNSFTKSPNKSMRGLIELTNDKLIFAKLHMWFTWILRACVCHLKEELLCGPLVEDVQIRIEQFKFMNDIDSSQQINFDTNTLNELNVSLNRLNSNSYDKTDSLEIGSLRVRHYNDLISVSRKF